MRLGSFVISYERTSSILNTVRQIVSQSTPPSKVVVVDNSLSDNIRSVFDHNKIDGVELLLIGKNLGPAGAAKIGLELLEKEGYDWIYWGDDDDPPEDQFVFERLATLIRKYPNAGALGLGGGKFNKWTGRTMRLQNSDLYNSDEVDFIPGNKSFFINAAVVRRGVLPSAELFFGFEELDYCLKIKKAGYKLYVDSEYWLWKRQAAGLGDPMILFKSNHWGRVKPTIRTYYSARNMLIILTKNGLYVALVYNFLKTVVKSILGFRYGWEYGRLSWKMNTMALTDFLMGRNGMKDMPIY